VLWISQSIRDASGSPTAKHSGSVKKGWTRFADLRTSNESAQRRFVGSCLLQKRFELGQRMKCCATLQSQHSRSDFDVHKIFLLKFFFATAADLRFPSK
jgi:hypothetical protein